MKPWTEKVWVSNGTLQRDCDYLFKYEIDAGTVYFYRRKYSTKIEGFIKEKNLMKIKIIFVYLV